MGITVVENGKEERTYQNLRAVNSVIMISGELQTASKIILVKEDLEACIWALWKMEFKLQ
jgi:hypothetical protein